MINRQILAVIPARGGSKGLPRKNIKKLGEKPLIAWTIESSLKSKFITKTIVSSDDDEILNISKEYKSDIIKRPSEFSTDKASSESVINNVLEELSKKKLRFDYIVLLQPTSPLRNEKDIDKAFEFLFENKATSLVSTTEIDNKILKAFISDEEGFIKGIANNVYPFMRRQDLPKTYMSNGAIYIIKTDEFIKNNSFYTTKTVSFIMDNEKSLDIDTIDDFKILEERVSKIR